jgi:hypothetical protein
MDQTQQELTVAQLMERKSELGKQMFTKAELFRIGKSMESLGRILSAERLHVEQALSYLQHVQSGGLIDCSQLERELRLYGEREKRIAELTTAVEHLL